MEKIPLFMKDWLEELLKCYDWLNLLNDKERERNKYSPPPPHYKVEKLYKGGIGCLYFRAMLPVSIVVY